MNCTENAVNKVKLWMMQLVRLVQYFYRQNPENLVTTVRLKWIRIDFGECLDLTIVPHSIVLCMYIIRLLSYHYYSNLLCI